MGKKKRKKPLPSKLLEDAIMPFSHIRYEVFSSMMDGKSLTKIKYYTKKGNKKWIDNLDKVYLVMDLDARYNLHGAKSGKIIEPVDKDDEYHFNRYQISFKSLSSEIRWKILREEFQFRDMDSMKGKRRDKLFEMIKLSKKFYISSYPNTRLVDEEELWDVCKEIGYLMIGDKTLCEVYFRM